MALALLGQIDAGLGRKDEALQEGEQAVKMRPIAVDALEGPSLVGTLALICAWTGDTDAAMAHLVLLQNIPGGPDYGQLRYDPVWSGLRGRKDFTALLDQLDPRLER